MQLALPGRPHLTYCTNIHSGETWSEIEAALAKYLPSIKQRISPDRPMGVGLRLSSIAAAELAGDDALEKLQYFLAYHDLYVFTVNAFPYGPFHGERVKERVYEPDWRRPERLAYTKCVADILSKLAPDDVESSISTVPGAFKAHIADQDDISRMTTALTECAAHLYRIREQTGRSIILALEPEPACFLETTDEAIDFFERHLFGGSAAAQFSFLTGLSRSAATAALREHLGLCFDVCHSAVAFEEAAPTLAAVRYAGIRIAKLQLSAALKVMCKGPEIEALLRRFDDGVYLHQTIEARNGLITRHLDLADAFAALRRGEAGGEWRIHCHVPVFLDSFENLESTQATLREVLGLCRTHEITQHLEVETYTWSVLPPPLRQSDLGSDIVRELQWVREELGA